VDPEWPDALKKSLLKLWDMHENEKSRRMTEAYDVAEKYCKLGVQKELLEHLNEKLQVELENTINENHVGEVSQNLLDIHKLLWLKAEKQRDQL